MEKRRHWAKWMNIFGIHFIENRDNFVVLKPSLPTLSTHFVWRYHSLGFCFGIFCKSKIKISFIHSTFTSRWTRIEWFFCGIFPIELSFSNQCQRLPFAKIKDWTREIKLKAKISFRIKNIFMKWTFLLWRILRISNDMVFRWLFLFLFCCFSHPVYGGFLLSQYFFIIIFVCC